MKIELTLKALKQIKKLPKNEAKKITRKLLSLEANPFSGKKLKGELKDRYSLRAWPYRIIYVVLAKKSKVQIEVIEHRQRIYK